MNEVKEGDRAAVLQRAQSLIGRVVVPYGGRGDPFTVAAVNGNGAIFAKYRRPVKKGNKIEWTIDQLVCTLADIDNGIVVLQERAGGSENE